MLNKLVQLAAYGCVLLMLSFLCASTKIVPAPVDHEVEELVQLMTGDFSNQVQHQRDADFADLTLHIRPIWLNDTSNRWMYVEYAPASATDQPDRQLIYKVERNLGSGLKILVYELPDPAKWVGIYKNPALFDGLKASDLLPREGCTIYLTKRNDGSYSGGSKGKGCTIHLKGAAYSVSLFVIKAKMLRIWDQGFNEKGEQIWGGAKGGSEFVKQ